MAAEKFFTSVNGQRKLRAAKQTSSGSADEGKIPALNSDGKIDPTMIKAEDTNIVLAVQVFS